MNEAAAEMNHVFTMNELQLRVRQLEAEIKRLTMKLTKDKLKKNTEAHQIYRLADGTIVPGVTSIVGLLAKPQLVTWANQLGLEGIDSSRYTEDAAGVGTLAHELIEADLTGSTVDLNKYSKDALDLAENALLSFYEWKKQHELVPIRCEAQMVSEKLKYGGTIDCYCFLDGKATLIDLKTGKRIYDDYFMQLAAYKNLLEELGLPVERCMILRVGRDETEGFEIRSVSDTRLSFLKFQDLLSWYYHDKEEKEQKRAEKKAERGKT